MKIWMRLAASLLAAVTLLSIPALAAGEEPWTPDPETVYPAGGVEELPEPVCLGEDSEYQEGEVSLLESDMEGALAALYEGISDCQEEIDIGRYNLTLEQLRILTRYIHRRYGELFYFNGGYRYYTSGQIISEILPNYTMAGSERTAALAFYNSEVERIAGLAEREQLDSDLEKVLFIHDYMVANYEYDYDGLAEGRSDIYDAYHFFKTGKGVCQAYTLAFEGLMDALGVPVSYVRSDSWNHIWNLAQVDGKWYHLDVTHDDGVWRGTYERYGLINHNQLLISEEQMKLEKRIGEKPYVYDWEYAYGLGASDLQNTEYDEYFWRDVQSPFVQADGNWYFVGNRQINRWNGSGQPEVVECTTNYSASPYSSLAYLGGSLYFNTYWEISSYSLEEKATTAYPETHVASGQILGFKVDGRTLTYDAVSGDAHDYREMILNPYTDVTNGENEVLYGYYHETDGVYIRSEPGANVVVAWYDGGKQVRADWFAGGENVSAKPSGAGSWRIFAADGGWKPLCGAVPPA